MAWYAVQHKPSQGDRALANLQNQNIQCLHPKVAVERIIAGKPTTRMEPLFPSYIFICIDPSDPMLGQIALYTRLIASGEFWRQSRVDTG
jgi:transcriptional antiterminator RfaH